MGLLREIGGSLKDEARSGLRNLGISAMVGGSLGGVGGGILGGVLIGMRGVLWGAAGGLVLGAIAASALLAFLWTET